MRLMVRPTKEELYHFYHTLDMKQSEIEEHFSYKNISRLLTEYNIPKKKRGYYSKMTNQKFIEKIKEMREDDGKFYDYSKVNYINQTTKIVIICPLHGEFEQLPRDHMRGHSGCDECSRNKRKNTCIEKYGESNPFKNENIKQKIKNTCLVRYGVENPSQSSKIHQKKIETSLKNYGVEYPLQSKIIKEKIKQTNLDKYGATSAMKNPEVAQRSVKTRIENNNFCNTNHSIECRDFVKNYIKQKGYDLDQCAFSDTENNLYEWGYNVNGKWVLYDLVVFELGFRGDKTKVIEILEYHGPFHYTKKDVDERGNEKAYPWNSKNLTIRESYEIDKIKEKFAKSLTINYTVVWSSKYH